MRKIFAIVMLVVLVFNIAGGVLFLQYFIGKTGEHAGTTRSYKPEKISTENITNIQVRSDYQSISPKLKLSRNDFQYSDAVLEITRNTLFQMSISDNEKPGSVGQSISNAKKVSDRPFAKKNQVPVSKKLGVDHDYNCPVTYETLSAKITVTIPKGYIHLNPAVTTTYLPTSTKPPELQGQA